MRRIRVMLVEDDPFWQENISSDLAAEADIEVAAVCGSKEEALQAAALDRALDVVLMDINLSGNKLDGLEAVQELWPIVGERDVKVIMLTSLKESSIILKSLQLGAVNYMTKQSCKDIVRAIREAAAGAAQIHADAAGAMRAELQLMELTPTEREVYELRRAGLSRQQISDRLYKSAHTIKSQIKSIRSKLLPFRLHQPSRAADDEHD
ncbi:response regulator [Paenibacillus pasadenensis]|uniref:DNA-binding response regulator, LuxR family n=1 Tax=Paenibacillus pasadenensis TaxID=217090 RepID=A0A2N5N595_9BACL|nr:MULTISPECIES: response regulator transcription factor [Paenibacillus]PLT45480.1 DNA-binding response regulator, LuxR family [Paenibacillus pasadenensis]QGG55954.1 response regulator [Paenibacillus sp. B01]